MLETSKSALEDFTHFLMYDEVKNIQANALYLFELACKYDVIPLREYCGNYFKSFKVSEENEEQVAKLVYEYKSMELVKALSDFHMMRDEYKFDRPRSIMDDLSSSPDAKSDITLLSRDKKEIKCFSYLLTCRSKVFEKTLELELQFQPGQKATISAPDFDADVIAEFVHFLKTDTVRDMKSCALDLLLMADSYRVSKLGIDCIDYICDHISDFDIFVLMSAARKVGSPKLSKAVNQCFQK